MPLTLLLDLDDTLLDTNLGEFVPAYFQALARHLSRWVPPDTMLSALMSGTRQMLANDDPELTLRKVFEKDFYPKLEVEKGQLEEAIDDFYDHAFPRLRRVTKRQSGALELVDWAIGRGFRVAIATDPLFPRKATQERIAWAGLDSRPFALISSYEDFHFTKSHAAYYAEILGRLGWPDGPVLVVGNDEERDLAPARELGLATYQIASLRIPATAERAGGPRAGNSGRGNLTELRRWLEDVDLDSLEPSFRDQRSILAILKSTPAVLQSLLADLSLAEWKLEPDPDEWAMIEIVAHLRDTEREVHHAQLRTLLEESQPFVPRPDAAVWAKQRKYLNEDGQQATADFAAARKHTLRELSKFNAELWNRPARHAIFGPTNSTEVVGFMADHDRLHVQQAWRTLHSSA